MITLQTPANQLTRYGKTAASRLKFLGITTATDLLRYYPIRYQDLREVVPIQTVQAGDRITLRGKIELITNRRSWRRRMAVTEVLLRDSTGAIPLIWFNQPYVGKILKVGDEVLVAGRAEEGNYPLHLANPTYEKVRREQTHVGRIVPFYALTHDLSQKQLRALLRLVLPLAKQLPDPLPESIRQEQRFMPLVQALTAVHFPADRQQLVAARRRLKFEELLLFVLQLFATKALVASTPAPAIPFNEQRVRRYVKSLPFTLTDDQRKAAWEILRATDRNEPMNRLLEGDVGSGKTVVASLGMVNAAAAGFQSALMAPTEVLASQHERTLRTFLAPAGLTVGLLTRTLRTINGVAVTKPKLLNAAAAGEVSVLVGTHAVLDDALTFSKLGLVVVDEQHRFGVEQRKQLRRQASTEGAFLPHLLSMTATPIPRSLALTVYGDLDLSIIKQLPAGRPAVTTRRLQPNQRADAYAAIREEVAAGHQAFVICPLVEESDRLGVKAATDEHRRLREEIFPNLRVGLLHGRLPGKKKVEVLERFRDRQLDVLVATAVVEVGVDVPNATLMLIEGAERFGLAQLHQLRGRIGRGSAVSTCLLLAESDTERVRQRLDALVQSRDGFHLAELDLKLRGPGELSGRLQSGFLDFKIATLHDLELMNEVRDVAKQLFDEDPGLTRYPELRAAVARADVHPE
ncbi:MAG: ATP-dependent DNA helicase RecG [Candidatus Kerfeldbacteria bacterium]|nr:ATP-dependent DNA helicase RecG [Candidatus Kerfeldbacteria bacterium]